MQSGANADLSGLFDQPSPSHSFNPTLTYGTTGYQQSSSHIPFPAVHSQAGMQPMQFGGFQQNQIGGFPIQKNFMGGIQAPTSQINMTMGMGMNPYGGMNSGAQVSHLGNQNMYSPGVQSVLQVGQGIHPGLRTAPPPPNQVVNTIFS